MTKLSAQSGSQYEANMAQELQDVKKSLLRICEPTIYEINAKKQAMMSKHKQKELTIVKSTAKERDTSAPALPSPISPVGKSLPKHESV